MSQDRAEQFAHALTDLEQGNFDAMLAMHTEDARLERPQQDHVGAVEDAQTFWKQYLTQFDDVTTTFDRIEEVQDVAILEWHSTGTLASGRHIEYAGVSLLFFDGDKVSRFATYYDTAAFLAANR